MSLAKAIRSKGLKSISSSFSASSNRLRSGINVFLMVLLVQSISLIHSRSALGDTSRKVIPCHLRMRAPLIALAYPP
ncbi:hypothetical protein D3C87_1917340 [compost metagenome]